MTTEDKQDPLTERIVTGRLAGSSWYLIPIMMARRRSYIRHTPMPGDRVDWLSL